MSDRKLLELAAKAAGINANYIDVDTSNGRVFGFVQSVGIWNPLTDDGDALRLAVKLAQMKGGVALMLNSRFNSTGFAQCYTNENVVSPTEYMKDDPYAATRRAIVRAAAEIGNGMSSETKNRN